LYKRAQQSGSQAAVLIMLITIAIVIYIMFLPVDERRDILGDDDDSDDNNDDDDGEVDFIYNETLIKESIGRLDYIARDNYEHDIPSLNLLSRTDAEILKKTSPFVIRNNWFEKKFETMQFDLENSENTDNLQLSFTAKKHRGILQIKLNDEKIFEGEFDSPTVEPILLPKEKLNSINHIEFSVSSVGFAFWKTNMFSFENLMITGDITDKSGYDSKNIFTVSSTEFYNLEKAELWFSTDCSPNDIGKLHIKINGEVIYSGIPDCGQINPPVDITDSITPKKNEIRFQNDRGQMLVDQIRIKTELKELPYPVFYFDISDEQLADIEDGDADLNLTIKFTDDYNYKEARVYINGVRTYMTTRDEEYVANLKPFAEEGTNSIKVEPYGDELDIRELIVHLY